MPIPIDDAQNIGSNVSYIASGSLLDDIENTNADDFFSSSGQNDIMSYNDFSSYGDSSSEDLTNYFNSLNSNSSDYDSGDSVTEYSSVFNDSYSDADSIGSSLFDSYSSTSSSSGPLSLNAWYGENTNDPTFNDNMDWDGITGGNASSLFDSSFGIPYLKIGNNYTFFPDNQPPEGGMNNALFYGEFPWKNKTSVVKPIKPYNSKQNKIDPINGVSKLADTQKYLADKQYSLGEDQINAQQNMFKQQLSFLQKQEQDKMSLLNKDLAFREDVFNKQYKLQQQQLAQQQKLIDAQIDIANKNFQIAQQQWQTTLSEINHMKAVRTNITDDFFS